jgi:hypothetical protein
MTDTPGCCYNKPRLRIEHVDLLEGAMQYEIRVQGHIGQAWSQWFDNLSVQELDDGSTRLRGMLPDQAALYGLLNKIRDLGLTLLSVQQLDSSRIEHNNDKGEGRRE